MGFYIIVSSFFRLGGGISSSPPGGWIIDNLQIYNLIEDNNTMMPIS